MVKFIFLNCDQLVLRGLLNCHVYVVDLSCLYMFFLTIFRI